MRERRPPVVSPKRTDPVPLSVNVRAWQARMMVGGISIVDLIEVRKFGAHIAHALPLLMMAERSPSMIADLELAAWWLRRLVDRQEPIHAGPSNTIAYPFWQVTKTFGLTGLLGQAVEQLLQPQIRPANIKTALAFLDEDIAERKLAAARAASDKAPTPFKRRTP